MMPGSPASPAHAPTDTPTLAGPGPGITGPIAAVPTWEPGQFWKMRISAPGAVDPSDRHLVTYVLKRQQDADGFDTYVFMTVETLDHGSSVDANVAVVRPEFWTMDGVPQRWRFPLSVGSTWTGSQFEGRDLGTVVAEFEAVETDTGLLDAYRVVHETPTGQMTEWYSPDLGSVVRAEASGDTTVMVLADLGSMADVDAIDEACWSRKWR